MPGSDINCAMKSENLQKKIQFWGSDAFFICLWHYFYKFLYFKTTKLTLKSCLTRFIHKTHQNCCINNKIKYFWINFIIFVIKMK